MWMDTTSREETKDPCSIANNSNISKETLLHPSTLHLFSLFVSSLLNLKNGIPTVS